MPPPPAESVSSAFSFMSHAALASAPLPTLAASAPAAPLVGLPSAVSGVSGPVVSFDSSPPFCGSSVPHSGTASLAGTAGAVGAAGAAAASAAAKKKKSVGGVPKGKSALSAPLMYSGFEGSGS